MEQQTGTTRGTAIRVLRSGSVAAAISFILSLTVIPIVLSQASLGAYGAWATLGGLLAMARLTEAGVPTEVARRVAELEGAGLRHEARQAVQQALSVMAVLAAIALVLGALVAVWGLPVIFTSTTRSELHTLRLVWLATVGLLVVSLMLATWFATLGGLQRQDYGAYSAVLGNLAGAVTTVVTVSLGAGIWGLFLGSLAQSLVGWTGPLRGMRLVRPELKLRTARISPTEFTSLMGASTFLMVASLANIAEKQVDKFVLSHYRGADAAGLFQLGISLSQQPAVLAALPAALLLAGTAELLRSDPQKLERLRALCEQATFALGLLTIGAIVVFAEDFVWLWLGPAYSEVAAITRVLAAACIPTVILTPWYFYIIGRAWHSIIVTSALANLALNLVGTFALTPRYGALGAAAGSAMGAVAAFVVVYVALRRRDAVSLGTLWRPAAVLLPLTAAAWWLLPDLTSWPVLVMVGMAWTALALALLLLADALPVTRSGKGLATRVSIRRG